jgi:DNA-binding transcriptional ArsR family regulator
MFVHVRPLSKKAPIPGSQPRRLPNAILRAIDNASHIVGIPRCVKDTFAEICRYVKQSDPLSPIWPTKEAIAERIGADKRTVHRHIAWLRDNALIEVLEQGRKSHNGKFIYAPIKLTRKAAELVMLMEPLAPKENHLPSDKIALGHTLTEPSNTSSQPSNLINNLPIDLSHLTSQGLQKRGIFKLMGMAKAKGKRLSDIVAVLGHQLTDKRGGVIFGFLKNRINDEKDYAYVARLAREAALRQSEQLKYEIQVKAVGESFKRQSFVNANKNIIFHVDANAQFMQVISPQLSGTERFPDAIAWQHRITSGSIYFASKEVIAETLENIKRQKLAYKTIIKKRVYAMMHRQTISESPSAQIKVASPSYSIEARRALQRATQELAAAIEVLPKGRSANIASMLSLLKNSAGRREPLVIPPPNRCV